MAGFSLPRTNGTRRRPQRLFESFSALPSDGFTSTVWARSKTSSHAVALPLAPPKDTHHVLYGRRPIENL
jgi:hypothetical protein